MDDFGDVPIGLTEFDSWMMKLVFLHFTSGFMDLVEAFQSVDREHFRMYYEMNYTPQEAFEEDLTCYGD